MLSAWRRPVEAGRRSVPAPPGVGGAPSATRPGAAARAGACASTTAGQPITPHVNGSSKNPAYSEWTKSVAPTAARPIPNARWLRVTSTSAHPTATSNQR